ncbi:glycosyltransferase family 2 protein [Patulibacter defluvii]|uniref:glycosyltransferase family 2 protein n=1 Tax=Patulibacter defluvii TaxID=3095358 RepID=UPI002A764B92|nr:glycosyltransferase [Patulibacter sp. DM4]
MLDVVLPVLDEAVALPGVLSRIPPGWRPIVVDNGSTDGSAAVAAAGGATVVHEPRRGFGAACAAGLRAADAELVAFMDADGSLDPADLRRLLPAIEHGAGLVLGRRVAEPGAWPWHARLANRALAAELRRRGVAELRDLGPMRIARRTALLELALRDRRSGWPLEMVVAAAAAGWPIAEVPVPYRPRTGGRSKVTGSVRGTVGALRDMRRVLAA